MAYVPPPLQFEAKYRIPRKKSNNARGIKWHQLPRRFVYIPNQERQAHTTTKVALERPQIFLCVHRSALALFPSSRKQAWKSSEPVRVCYFARYTVRHCYDTAAPLSACGLMPECSLSSATKAIPLEKVSSSSFNASAATPRNSLSFSCASCFLVRKKTTNS